MILLFENTVLKKSFFCKRSSISARHGFVVCCFSAKVEYHRFLSVKRNKPKSPGGRNSSKDSHLSNHSAKEMSCKEVFC